VQQKARVMEPLHESVSRQIQKINNQYAFKANKDRKKVIFEPNDCVWEM
jgi:hypothetical protein